MSAESWLVAPEYEAAIFIRLGHALRALGYEIGEPSRGIAGSQEMTTWAATGSLGNLTIESETYVGLTVSGLPNLVAQVRERF